MESNITFETKSNAQIIVKLNGKEVGTIWSSGEHCVETDLPCGSNPDSIQICGFRSIEGVWACHKYTNEQDCVIVFRPKSDNVDAKLKDYTFDKIAKIREKLNEVDKLLGNINAHEYKNKN